ncbi:MAG: hypothetical protein ACLUU0_11680 [Anaerostipes hadrus]
MTVRRRRMTKKEIKERREIKRQLQEQGIKPPDKPRLNRRKFAQEVCKEWDEMDYINPHWIMLVLSMMTNSGNFGSVSLEDIGILKLKKCSMLLQQTIEEKGKMSVDEVTELLMPIWKL